MKYIKSYRIFESKNEILSLFDVCDSLLSHSKLWQESKNLIDPSVSLIIDTKSKRHADAHFNRKKSTPEKIVIQMGGSHQTPEGKGTLSHELIHALQYLTNSEGDLAFITDITREINALSENGTWERLVYSIYISCPQELDAWEAESFYDKSEILKDIVPWMESFDPSSVAKELMGITLEKNKWDLKSFSEIPQFFADVYKSYNEPVPGSIFPDFINYSLEEFLNYYSPIFKSAARRL
jgi:hypothetical protein